MLSACVAWCVITRPLTGLALAVPIAVVVLIRVRRRGLWSDLGLATALGLGVLQSFRWPTDRQPATGWRCRG